MARRGLTRRACGALVAALTVSSCTGSPPARSPETDSAPATASAAVRDLSAPATKEIAMQLVSSAENSTLDWRAQFSYLEDIGDGRGYTGGIVGFCSGTGDMLALVEGYTARRQRNPLRRFLPALRAVVGTDSHAGLGRPFVRAWRRAASDRIFLAAQQRLRDRMYFDPAVRRGRRDGLGELGQFIYYDALVMHGPGGDASSFGGIRAAARRVTPTPAQGGREVRYLHAFLDVRTRVMRSEAAHADTSRIDTAQRVFLRRRNLRLALPLRWSVYGDRYVLRRP